MRVSTFGLFAILLFSTSFAEPVFLICEHDGGVDNETGLPSGLYGEVFSFTIDPMRKELIASFEYADKTLLQVHSEYILVKLEYKDSPSSEHWWYTVNRYTGTLFAKRVTAYGGTYHSKGKCVTDGDKMF